MKYRVVTSLLIKGLRLFATNTNYRTLVRIAFKLDGKKRYIPQKVKFDKYIFHIPDGLSFIWQFKEIFYEENYKFKVTNISPVIYDCGSNVGLSVLYFKNLFPESIIKAFEADPAIIKYLRKNIEFNHLSEVEIIDKAVWTNNDGIELQQEGADGASIFRDGNKIKIDSVRLRDLIQKEEKINFLKMDIEGAEFEVIKDCRDQLYKVDNLFIEYHSFTKMDQQLDELLLILKENNYRYFIRNAVDRLKPFINRAYPSNSDMDLQLNIFAYRENN